MLKVKIGAAIVNSSTYRKLLIVITDDKLMFDEDIRSICKKVKNWMPNPIQEGYFWGCSVAHIPQ